MVLFVIVFLLTKNFDFFLDLDDLMANNNKGNNKLNNKKITQTVGSGILVEYQQAQNYKRQVQEYY